jgi:2-keto-3-deoxy-L-rhamnonate aldolase RhmA
MIWENRFRDKLDAGLPTLGTRIHSSWATVVELVGYTGMYDYIEFTAEYAPFDIFTFEHLGRAFNLYDLTGVIKVGQESRAFQTAKALNSGFMGVNFADVRNAADAAACVAMVRAETPSLGGTRGVEQARDAKHVLEVGSPAWVEHTRRTVVTLMIEKKEAVEDVEGILDTEGVDMIVFGARDYALSCGHVGQIAHPAVLEAQAHVFEEARKRRIPVRGEFDTLADAEKFIEKGMRHINIGLDLRILHNWWRDNGKRLQEIYSTLGVESRLEAVGGAR